MKKLVIAPLICMLAITFCFGGVAYAQEDESLPDPGITPDSLFYFADGWGEQIGLMFAFNAHDKAEKAMQYAGEKLAEVNAMQAKNKVKEATRATYQYNNRIMTALQVMDEVDSNDVDTLETVALAAAGQIRYCNDNMAGATEDAQGTLTQARDRARDCEESALQHMAQGDPEEAAQLHLRLMEHQLNRVQVISEEDEPVRLQNALQEFARLNALGEDILETAGGKGKGAEVGQMYGQATATHLQILAQVHSRVQAQSQQAVDDAMQICVQNHERVVNELKAQNQLGQVPEESPIPENVSGGSKNKGSAGTGGNGNKP